jgi:hypothetical protein
MVKALALFLTEHGLTARCLTLVGAPFFIVPRHVRGTQSRDGNRDSIPDSLRGISLSGDGYVTNLIPAGI